MPPRQRLNTRERGMALAWIQEGVPLREIGRRLGVSHSVINRLRDRWFETGTVEELPRSGRPRVTTGQQDRYIVVTAMRNHTATARSLRDQLRNATQLNVGLQTVRNRLREHGIRSRRPAVNPPLSQVHRHNRAAWARHHRRWLRQQWAGTLFSDESRFALSFNDGRIRVWRCPGERFADATVMQHDRFGGGSVMVWGGFSFNHRTPLHRVEGRLTGVTYRDTILRPLVLPALRAIGPGAQLQDDNAPCHRAAVVNRFLEEQHVTRMDWPARSPDMNPIEHLWDVLGRRVRAHDPPAAYLDGLFELLQQEWQAIPQETLQNLVLSMRRRCNVCLNANGGFTPY